MKFLDNLNIKAKLYVLLALPIIGLLILTTINVGNSFSKISQMDRIENLSTIATKISSFIHETQKERGE
jgi:hypothetical protein